MPDTIEIDGPGAMIRWAREQAEMSQAELARTMGKHRNDIYVWETGKNMPGADNFLAALDACGFDVVLEPRDGGE